MKRLPMLALLALIPNILYAQGEAPPTPADVKPGSITCEDVPYPHPVSYMPLTLYGQDIRMAYMDVPAQGQPNGRTVVLFHGMNFAGFYWGGPIDALRKEGFRVVVPDQIGFGRSSKPIIPYNFHDMARNTRPLLQQLKIDKAFIVGHSMGGMLAARFATQYPDVAERVVIYNPDRPPRPALRTAVGQHRRSLQTQPWHDLSADSRRHLQVLLAQSIGVETGVRQVSEDSLCMDAERRLAAVRDGAGASRADDVPRPGD